MGAVPQPRLVAQLVEADAAVRRRAIQALELLDPVAVEGGTDFTPSLLGLLGRRLPLLFRTPFPQFES
jgi:hypothetical protein